MQLMPLVVTKDQDNKSACAPAGASMWMEYLLMRLGHYVTLRWEEAYQELTGGDGGTDPIAMLGYLKTKGLPDENGRYYKLKSWQAIGLKGERIAQLDAGKPLLCMFPFPDYDQFPPPAANVFEVRRPERYGIQHVGVMVGYNTYGPIMQHSALWWGVDGLINLPWSYEVSLAVAGEMEDLPAVERHHIELPVGSKTVTVDGKPLDIDEPAQIINGRTMVPLRFVAEVGGKSVDWVAASNTVTIDG